MSSNKPIFVDGMNPHGPIQDGHHSRLYHKKSRTGCQRCRLRRVKCNEAKPICRHCERHGVCCIYDRLDPATKHSTESRSVDTPQNYVPVAEPAVSPLHRQNFRVEESSTSLDASYAHNHGLVLADSPDEPVESRRRRMVELELMHFYITETGPSIAFDKNSSYDLFVKAIPRAAIKSDSLLYSMYAIAALHQTKTTGGQGPSIPSPTAVAMARENHQIYSQLAFQRHHQDLAQISHANVDMLIMTANIMRIIAFVVLSERPLVPYMAPLHWLTITKSHAQVFLAAWDLVGDNSSTQTARLIKSTPVVWDYDERQGADKREGLEHLLQPVPGIDGGDEDHPSLWDDGVRRAYESTLSYIGGIWQSVQRNDPLGPIARRLILFPILVEQRFIDLVGEAKPRALVILAHYFALVTIIKSFWFVGNTGPREVRSIAAYLPAHWQRNMELPLRLVNEGLPYSQAATS